MNLEVPNDWRKGQTIFNFLWWLNAKHGVGSEIVGFDEQTGKPNTATGRMADPFHLSDAMFDELYAEFIQELKALNPDIK